MSTALISGGSGLIGTSLTKLILSRGHRVVVLTRQQSRLPRYGESVQWDGIHPGPWMEWVSQADWIIQLAGENIGSAPWTKRRLQQIRDSRVHSGELLTEAISRSSQRPQAFIQMSAIGYYGTQNPDDLAAWDETRPSGEDRLAGICREWEDSSCGVEALGVRRLIIRAGLVLSSHGGVLSRLELPFRLFAGGFLGNGRQVYSWIHIDDLTHGILHLLEKPQALGAFNFTAPEPLAARDFARVIGRITHRPAWLNVPSFILKMALGEMSTLVLDGQRVIPDRLQKEAGYSFLYPSLEKALQQIHS